MKRIYSALIVFALTFQSFSQTTNDVGKIALSVVMPENHDALNASQLSKLETKILQIVNISGLAASGYNNNFVIYPKFAIYESSIVEGGMQNITIVTAELSLFIKQVDNNMLFSVISKPLKGSGSNKELAINNAITKVNINDVDFSTFIEQGKLKIVTYYETTCGDILKKADTYSKMNQYEQALGLLMSVPEEVSSCYTQIQEKSIEVYKAYQSQNCSEMILKAKTAIVANDYIRALNILSNIDPSASCFKEVEILIKTTETKLKAEEKKQWDFQMKHYNDNVSLEKRRIDAIKEIAVSYYKSQPQNINYNYIIK